MGSRMRVTKISTARNDVSNDHINLVTVQTVQGHVLNIDLIRTYNIVTSGFTDQDIQEIVMRVYDYEHRNIQEERVIRRLNTAIEEFITKEGEIKGQV